MKTNDYVSLDIILGDVLVLCADEGTRHFAKGWYVSQIQRALEELSIETFWNERTVDLPLDKEMLQLEIPENMFNIREVYLWSGECCQPDNSVIVHYKRHFNNKPGVGGEKYTARRKESQPYDPFFRPFRDGNLTGTTHSTSGLYYANMQNGLMMFSSSCASYDMVRFVGNAYGGNIGDAPIIPRFLRDAAVDYVVEKFFRAMTGRDPSYASRWNIAETKLNKRYDGSWDKAKYRIKNMDTWEMNSMKEYFGRMNY